MANSVFPAATATSATTTTFGREFTAANVSTLYSATVALDPGVYTITCVAGTIATVTFMNGTTTLTTVSTVSGTVSVTLGTAVTRILYSINTGSNIAITLTQTKIVLPFGSASGVVQTYTNSQTLTSRGYVYALLVGGGAGGQSGPDGQSGGGNGGISGRVLNWAGAVNTDVALTIGAFGNGGSGGPLVSGNAGGDTVFGNYATTANGSAGNSGSCCTSNNTGTRYGNLGGTSAASAYPWVDSRAGHVTSGGSGGSYNYAIGAGPQNSAGGNIGQGGTGGYDGVAGGNANGYGGGGGGGGGNSRGAGGRGTQGIAYVLVN
jgi:hypothetical protein